MGSSAKARRMGASSRKLLRSGVNTLRTMTKTAATKASGYTQAVVTKSTKASVAVIRPVAIGLILLALIWIGLMFLGKFQLWMTSAGVFMIAMSMVSAFQEFKYPKTVQSYQDFLDEEIEHCAGKLVTLPHLSPVKASMNSNVNSGAPVVVHHRRATQPSHPQRQSKPVVSTLTEISTTTATTPAAAASTPVLTPPVSSPSPAEMTNKLVVMHCGTVIDIQGSHGFIIPHDLNVGGQRDSLLTSGTKNHSRFSARQIRIPLVIPFDLQDDQSAIRQQISVGKTVEFAYSDCGADCQGVCALNVTPVPSNDEEIIKSRNALLSCKQAREESFAKAMGSLTMISPRNEPVKHHVDLIKYAEQLDDHELPFDQFI